MAGGRTFVIRLITDSKQTESAFKNVGIEGAKFNKSMILAGAALGALMSGMKQAVSAAVEYDKTLMNLTTQIGMTQEAAQALGAEFMTMTDLRAGPQDLADAFYFIASAGLEGTAAMEAMEASAKAAAVGLGEAEVIADLLTTIMGAYGSETISASKATDLLLFSVRNGKAEASEMASAMGAVVPIAAAMGVEFGDVATALAVLTNRGATAADGVTQLRSFMVGILQPSKEAEDALNRMGLSSQQLQETMAGPAGLFGALTLIQEATGGSAQAFGEITGRVEALNFLSGILGGNLEETAELFGSQTDAIGELDKAFIVSGQTFSGQVDLMKAQWGSLMVEMGGTSTGPLTRFMAELNTTMYELRFIAADSASEAKMSQRSWEQAAGAYDAARQMLDGLNGSQRQGVMASQEYQAYISALNQAQQNLMYTEQLGLNTKQDMNQIIADGADVSNFLTRAIQEQIVAEQGLYAGIETWNGVAVSYWSVKDAADPLFDTTSLLREEYNLAAAAAQKFADEQLLAVSPMLQLFDAEERLTGATDNLKKAKDDLSVGSDEVLRLTGESIEAQARYDAALIASTPVIDTFTEDVVGTLTDEFGFTQDRIGGVMTKLDELELRMKELNGMKATMYVDIQTREGLVSGTEGLPRKAEGGPVMQKQSYIVGERGPELFVPSVSGTIIPNDRMANYGVPMSGSGSGSQGIVVNVSGAIDPEGTARTIIRVLEDAQRRTGARLVL
jgi:TP901 family phage tail tape measure protein